ncbi:MAG: hypothetical protein EPO30_11960 [Lysobacteraceae bacterium]|nr:MAG: hypothetical protein EPO30_11960 [Xanthomonadaceae bacterium]
MGRREMHLVVGGRLPKVPLGVFSSRELADAYCARHNAWYGAEHPLSPLEVRPVEVDPEPLPLGDPSKDEARQQVLTLAAIHPMERRAEPAPQRQERGQVLRLRRS